MAGIFATLVALCRDGGCLLPDLLGGGGRDDIGPPPDLKTREEARPRDPRQAPPGGALRAGGRLPTMPLGS
jgi:hypothetical protein